MPTRYLLPFRLFETSLARERRGKEKKKSTAWREEGKRDPSPASAFHYFRPTLSCLGPGSTGRGKRKKIGIKREEGGGKGKKEVRKVRTL